MSNIASLRILAWLSGCTMILGCGGVDNSFTMEANNPESYRKASLELAKAENSFSDALRAAWKSMHGGKAEESKEKLKAAEEIQKRLPDLHALVVKTQPMPVKAKLEALKSQLAATEKELVDAESLFNEEFGKKDLIFSNATIGNRVGTLKKKYRLEAEIAAVQKL